MFDWDWKIENKEFLQKTIERCRRQEIILPTFNDLKHPETISKSIQEKLENIIEHHKAPALPDKTLSALKSIRQKGEKELGKN